MLSMKQNFYWTGSHASSEDEEQDDRDSSLTEDVDSSLTEDGDCSLPEDADPSLPDEPSEPPEPSLAFATLSVVKLGAA